MSSKIKVDTIENVAGSGNVSLGSGHNLVVPGNVTGQGTLAVSGNTTVGGTLINPGLVTASAGVAIGGTGSANTLDDYEEGSFTPVFGGSGGNPTVTHSLQLGTYVKIGKMVYVNISIAASGTPSSGAGDLIITGLPFSSKAGVQQCGSIAFANNITFGSSITDGGCNIEGNVAYLNVNNQEYSGTSAMGRVQTSGIHHSNPRIVCSICYETA